MDCLQTCAIFLLNAVEAFSFFCICFPAKLDPPNCTWRPFFPSETSREFSPGKRRKGKVSCSLRNQYFPPKKRKSEHTSLLPSTDDRNPNKIAIAFLPSGATSFFLQGHETCDHEGSLDGIPTGHDQQCPIIQYPNQTDACSRWSSREE